MFLYSHNTVLYIHNVTIYNSTLQWTQLQHKLGVLHKYCRASFKEPYYLPSSLLNTNSNSNSTFIALNLCQKADSKAHHTKTLFNIHKPETLQGCLCFFRLFSSSILSIPKFEKYFGHSFGLSGGSHRL